MRTKSKSKVVMFDVDGVLADFIAGFTRLGHRLMPDLVTERSTLETKVWRAEPGDERTWAEVMKSRTFWYDMPPLVSEEESLAVAAVAAEFDTYFVTARVGVEAKRQTERWLSDVIGVLSPTVVISPRKGEVASALFATHAIDDKAGNAIIISWMSRNTKSYILDRLHNQFDHAVVGGSVTRLYSVASYVDAVRA